VDYLLAEITQAFIIHRKEQKSKEQKANSLEHGVRRRRAQRRKMDEMDKIDETNETDEIDETEALTRG
jgi:hypothetical protein